MKCSSYIELSKSALQSNLSFLQSEFGSERILSSVVKANAYGHGIKEYVHLAQEIGIRHFSVFSADEADQVDRIRDEDTTILIMGWVHPDELEEVINRNYEITVFDTSTLFTLIDIAKRTGRNAKIHLEIETGMNRTGIRPSKLRKSIAHIKKNRKHIDLVGVCTHLAGAESIANYYRIRKQIRTFKRIRSFLSDNGITPKISHIACSAAAVNYPASRMDLIRVGILQYGFWPSAETWIHWLGNKKMKEDPLKRVIAWKSSVMSVKSIRSGEFIGYGNSYLAQSNKVIAIIPVGYSDGYNRNLSNLGSVLIHEHRCRIIGLVNMNMIIADITDLEKVSIGDEVVLIGNQGDVEISVTSFSGMSDMLNYESLTRIPSSIPRVIVD